MSKVFNESYFNTIDYIEKWRKYIDKKTIAQNVKKEFGIDSQMVELIIKDEEISNYDN